MNPKRVILSLVAVALAFGGRVWGQSDAEFHYRSDDREFGISVGLDRDRYYEAYGPPYVEQTQYYTEPGYAEIDYVDVDEFGEIEIDVFFDSLAPYGEWRYRRPYGWVWTPQGVHPDWRPYTRGHWTWTDHGWTWVSREPWGWATEHYGRWYFDPGMGWTWVPGTRWGPAWVAWRQGPNHIGWAPLPPQVRWRAGYGLDSRIDLDVALGPSAWSFVEDRYFVSPQVHSYIAPPSYNVTYLRRSPLSLEYAYVGDRIVNRGIPVSRVERIVGRRIYPTPVRVYHSTPSRGYAQFDGGTLNVYRPQFRLSRTRDYDRWDRGRGYDWDDRRGRQVDDRRERDRDGRYRGDRADRNERDRRDFDRDRDDDRRRTIQSDPRQPTQRGTSRTSDPRVRREIDSADVEWTGQQQRQRSTDSPRSDAVRQPPTTEQQQAQMQAARARQAQQELDRAERQRAAAQREPTRVQVQRPTAAERQRSAELQRQQRAETARQAAEVRREAAKERADAARQRQVRRAVEQRNEAAERERRRTDNDNDNDNRNDE